jgi:diaminohydroxyphosphoribosylaminopyrimidine deaminase / 5-amino-6-(5-phosphoribosylamino)uracil reductase
LKIFMNASASSGSAYTAAADAVFMDRALDLAARGAALASPNPMVGAVLVRDGRIIGEGFHTYDGIRHAEIIALEASRNDKESIEKSASLVGRAFRHDSKPAIRSGVSTPEEQNAQSPTTGGGARGATLYINLEPCCHTGRTGPCTQALIAAGIARVVAAMPDPNPAVTGRGFKQLRESGIEVTAGLREAEARRLNEAFARWIVSRKPLVTLKSALTLDGQLVLPHANARTGTSRKERWISSPESRAEVQRMRHASDALLTGIGTVLMDDPLLTDRTGLPRRRKLLRVVMDSRLRLPLRSKLVRSADGDVLVFTRAREDSPKSRALRRAGVEVVHVVGRGARPDLGKAVAELGRRDVLSVLLEAGADLNSAAFAAGIVDKMRVFLAPKIAAYTGKRPGAAAALKRIHSALELQNITIEPFGPDFAIEGYLYDVYRAR